MASELSETTRLLLSALPLARPTTIVDVGANPIHEAPYTALLRAGGCRVVGFEPQPSAFAELQKIKSDHETYFPHAVGRGGPVTLRIYAQSGMTSIFRPHHAGIGLVARGRMGQVVEEIEMETVALDDLAELPEFDLLKIDIQGAENLVFEGGARVLSRAVCVITELRYLRLYRGEPMMSGSDSELRRQGFILHKFVATKSMPLMNSQSARLRRRMVRDQLVDGDAAYLRDLARIAEYDDGQLCHLAVLGDAVLNSVSLVLVALDELVRRGRVDAGLPAAYVDALPEGYRA